MLARRLRRALAASDGCLVEVHDLAQAPALDARVPHRELLLRARGVAAALRSALSTARAAAAAQEGPPLVALCVPRSAANVTAVLAYVFAR